MNRFTYLMLSGVFLCAVILAGCKSRKEVVQEYSYLIKDSEATKETTSGTPEAKETAALEPEIKKDFRKQADRAIEEAESYLGTPYRYGGINKNGIDCSGLMANSYRVVGVELPRSSRDQALQGKPVKRSKVTPGDLIFFSNKGNKSIDHVGMVTQVKGGEVTFIHASTSAGVRFDRLDTGYWSTKFVTARRPDVD